MYGKSNSILRLIRKHVATRKVFSFSIYGNVNKYIGGLLQNCKDINLLYPDFWIYVYMGNDFDQSIIHNNFSSIRNLKLIQTNCSGHLCMFNRFFAIDDTDVQIMFSRDCDSRINERDQYCIRTFLYSDKKFQIIRDHKEHNVKILGGMWGIKKGLLDFNIKDEIYKNITPNTVVIHGDDQKFLEIIIYPVVVNSSIIFDPFHHFSEETTESIPIGYTEVYGLEDHVGFIHMPKDLNNPFGEHTSHYSI